MKLLLLFILVPLFLAYSIAQNNPAKMATLIVKIEGLENNKGKVRFAVCDSEENFSSDGSVAYRGGDSQIIDKKASFTAKDMPYGNYAVKVFHDENNNDELDSNFIGIPQEAYGFSNNARGSFGPPSWDDSKFEIKTDSLVISIKVD